MNPIEYLYTFIRKLDLTPEERQTFYEWYKITHNKKSLVEIANENEVGYEQLRYRVKTKGMTIERAIREIKGENV